MDRPFQVEVVAHPFLGDRVVQAGLRAVLGVEEDHQVAEVVQVDLPFQEVQEVEVRQGDPQEEVADQGDPSFQVDQGAVADQEAHPFQAVEVVQVVPPYPEVVEGQGDPPYQVDQVVVGVRAQVAHSWGHRFFS